AATHAAIREQVRRARANDDTEALDAWLTRLEQAKAARRQRIHDLPHTLRNLLLAVLVALTVLLGVLVVLGIAVGWGFVAAVGNVLLFVAAVGVHVVLYGTAPAWLVAAYRAGHLHGALPAWAQAPAQRDEATMIVTPVGIAEALANLGVAPLNKALKGGWSVQFDTPPVRVNKRGYQAVFSLPMGVTPEMVADKRTVLARNLHRDPLEVWPSAAERAGYVDLWVADRGSTEKPAPEYPLLHSGTADVFTGIPLGVSQRGDQIAPALVQANLVWGGMMGQGKSNGVRVAMLGAALDPLAELWVYVFANNGDFDAYQPRLARYERGVDDEVAAAGLASLRDLYAEVARREERLAELGAKKVTRGLAEKHPDLRPIVAVYSECHELFGHDEYGKDAADYAVQTLRRARKTAITLGFDTQSSRAEAIPPKIVELVQINACFAVKTWRSNDGFLGDGSFQAGIRATELRPGKDRGTSILTGATEERFEIVRWYFIPVDDDTGWDAATDVITRAMAKVHPAVPVGGQPRPTTPAVTVDHLADIATALRGEKRVRTQVILGRLAEANPDLYERWNFGDLTAALADHKIGPRKSDGVMVVRAEDIHQAITERDHSVEDHTDEDTGS
ncbi:MAG TPA: hypothetical protein VIS06_22610, partial [Mycobacteriales bacterium]